MCSKTIADCIANVPSVRAYELSQTNAANFADKVENGIMELLIQNPVFYTENPQKYDQLKNLLANSSLSAKAEEFFAKGRLVIEKKQAIKASV